jgi:fumarate reductase flavoprotein subunit
MPRGPWHEEVDLIVVGASVAGLAATVMAADRGCRTILVERAKELGGGAATEAETIAAGGTRFQRDAGVADDPSRFADDVLRAAGPALEPALVRALAEESPALVAWLADRCGTPITLLTGRVSPGHSAPRLHFAGERGGTSLLTDLVRAATRHSHVSVRMGTTVERLVRDEEGVRGVTVRAERRGAGQALGGRILLACGGFAADDALVAEHCATAAQLPYCGPARATGEGLRLGREVGAATRRLGACLVNALVAMPGQLAVTAPLVAMGAVLVNQAGRRFANEGAAQLELATRIRAQPGRVAYLVFDERVANAARAADPFFARVVLPRTGRRGPTVEDLAKQFELDGGGLRATVEGVNAAIEGGTPDPFGRDRFGSPFQPPLHAIRVTGGRWATLGGLAVDGHAAVLDADGRPIPGLYATAAAAEGLGGDGLEGGLDGTDALAALGLARLAAQAVIAGRAEEPS